MKLFGNPYSTCTRKVLTVLKEKQAPYEFVMVDLMKGEHKQPAHLARQPFGVVPALEDGDFSMFESRAIIRYLDAKLPGVALTPSNLRERAIMEQWMSVELSYFYNPSMKIIMQMMFGKMAGKSPDMDVVNGARAEIGRVGDILDKHLAKNTYFSGNMFTLADVCFMPYVEYLFASESGDLVTSRPAFAAWWNRVNERPSWRAAIGK